MKNKNLFLLLWCLATLLLVPSFAVAASVDSKSKSNVDKEKSTENKLLNSASMGTIGIGASQALSAQSEKSADADAEQDMKAYLATFRCDYGQGHNILGGQTNIQLPDDVELIQYVSEYKQLAAGLKSDKAALGIKPGIEAEIIFDSASGGLYDNVGFGRVAGAFTSLSRALMDENSTDAAAWQAQKDASAKKLKDGVTLAGVGIVGSIAGNALISAAQDGKLKNIFAHGTGGGGVIVGLSGAESDGMVGYSSGVGNIFGGNGNNVSQDGGGQTGTGDALDAQIARIQTAHSALQSDVSSQASGLYNDILSVKDEADAAGIDTTTVEAAIASAKTSMESIDSAVSAAGTALANAQKLERPQPEECEAEKPEEPNKEDYKNENAGEEESEYDEDGYKDAQSEYKETMEKYESDLKECKKNDEKYEKDVKKVIADASRFADEAERQLNLARAEVTKMQKALTNAQAAKDKGIKAQEDAKRKEQEDAAKEAAEQKAQEDKKQQIRNRVSQINDIVKSMKQQYDDISALYFKVVEAAPDELPDEYAAAQDQVNAIKSNAAKNLEDVGSALGNVEKQATIANKAETIADADAAVTEATHQSEIVQARGTAMAELLNKINDAKDAAKAKYDADQAAADLDENSEEEESETVEEED